MVRYGGASLESLEDSGYGHLTASINRDPLIILTRVKGGSTKRK